MKLGLPAAPTHRAFAGGGALGLVIGLALGALGAIGAGALSHGHAGPGAPAGGLLGKAAPSKWVDTGIAWMRLPEQATLGPTPQTVSLPASSYDFGGVGQPLNPAAIEAGSIVKVEAQAQAGRVGVSLARPNGGELVSREAVLAPEQGKTTLYFRTLPGMGPVVVLLRSADNTPAGASAAVTQLQIARQADLDQGEMQKIGKAGLY